MENAQIQLFDQMIAVFNEEDIRELCFRLNIAYGDLNGQNRRAKTISLVKHCNQTNRTAELAALCQKARPLVVWPQPDAFTAFVSTTETVQPEKSPLSSKQSSNIPMWVWGVVGLLLLALVVFAIWQPWDGREGEEETAVIPSPISTSFSSASPSDNRIDLNQTVNGKIIGAGSQSWTYIGPHEEADIRVDGGPDDTFVIIITYETGGEAAYIDYSGRGAGELVKYYDLQENMQIIVEQTENDGAEYTLSVKPSESKYLEPDVPFGGEIRGANSVKFLYGSDPMLADIILEMTNAEQPLLEVYFSPDGQLVVSGDQLDENGRLILSDVDLTEDEQYEIIIRDLANNGAVYQIEVKASDGG